jgi:hypothetical protein
LLKSAFRLSFMINNIFVQRHGLGLAYEGLQLYPKAKAAVDEAVRLHPRHPFALCTLGDVCSIAYKYPFISQY